MWALALQHTPRPPVLLCKYSLVLLLLVHSASSFDTQPVVPLLPCSSSECYVSPAASTPVATLAASATSEAVDATEAVNSTDLILVFKVGQLTVF